MNNLFGRVAISLICLLSACGGGDIPQSTESSSTAIVASTPTVKKLSVATESAVNLQDAISVLKMIVGLDVNPNAEAITAYQAFAADYDGNGKVEISDAIGILKEIVGLTTNGPQWVLIDPLDSTVSTKANTSPGVAPILTATTTKNLVAVLRGDVIGSSFRTVSYADGMALIFSTCPNGTTKTAATREVASLLCEAPKLITNSPSNNASDVISDLFAGVVITTDSKLDYLSITTDNIKLTASNADVAGVVTAIGVNGFKFTPASKLNYVEKYVFTASVKDELGKKLAVKIYFSTLQDPCIVVKKINAYPVSYMGAFAIPKPENKLPDGIIRMMDTKDYYPYVPPQVSGCSNTTLYARNLYSEELDRLKSNGVEVVWVTNYGPWKDLNSIPWEIDPTRVQIPENEFSFLISEIKKRGMKAYFYWQMWGSDVKGNEYPMGSNFTNRQLQTWMKSHRQLMIDLAKKSSTYGIDGLGVDWQAYYIPNLYEPNLKSQYISMLSETIDEIKKNYSGKLILGLNAHIFPDPSLFSKVDLIRLSIAPRLTVVDNANLTVSLLRDRYISEIKTISQYIGDISNYSNKPKFEFQFSPQSRDKYLIEGWVEDGFCVSQVNDKCIQKSYFTDYSVQAIAAEAAFQAIKYQNFIEIGAVTTGTYWHTDDMTPGDYGDNADFPNLSSSFRNKPAEDILKYWYQKH
jgi:hypothetical protein